MGILKKDLSGPGDLHTGMEEDREKSLPSISPQITWFHYNIDEILYELNSCLYQLACGKIDSVICHFT